MTRFGCRGCRRPPLESPKEVKEEPQALITQVDVTTTQPEIANEIIRAEASVRLRTSVSETQQFYSPLSSVPKTRQSSAEGTLKSLASNEIPKVPESPHDSEKTPPPPAEPSPPRPGSRVVDRARDIERAEKEAEDVRTPPLLLPIRKREVEEVDSTPAFTPIPIVTPAPEENDPKQLRHPSGGLQEGDDGFERDRKAPPEILGPAPSSAEEEIDEEIPIRAPTPNAYEASPRLLPARSGSRQSDFNSVARRRATRHFVEAWVRLLEMCFDDVLEWTDAEALVRAHILYRLLLQDIRCTLEMMDTIEDTSTPTWRGMLDIWAQHRVGCESSILNSNTADDPSGSPAEQSQDGSSIPMVLSLFPPEILAEVPVLSRSFNERYIEAFGPEERGDLRQRVAYLSDQMTESVRMKEVASRWSYFSQLMTIFGLNDKFNFEIHMHNLLTPHTSSRWLAIVNDVAAATNSCDTSGPTGDLVRVQSTTRLPSATSSPFDTQKVEECAETKSALGASPHAEEGEDTFVTPATEPKRRRSSIRRQISKIKRSRLLRYRRSKHVPKLDYIGIHHETTAPASQWIEEQKKGVIIAYRMIGDGLVACKVRSRLKLPFVNAMVTLDDFDSFTAWVPYCIRADKLAQYSNACYLLSYIADLPWPIRKRETLALAGCTEALEETGQMVVYVMTLPPGTKEVMGVDIPPENPKIPRIQSYIGFFVRPLALDETALEIRAIMEPGSNSKMLRTIIPWMVKNTVVDFFTKIVSLAHKTDMEEFRARGHPHQDFYDSMEKRVTRYLEERGPLVESSEAVDRPDGSPGHPPSANQVGASGHKGALFDESDSLWYMRIPSFKMH